jgi:outer membrane protein OmpA-like peptidoglycan-associated protein
VAIVAATSIGLVAHIRTAAARPPAGTTLMVVDEITAEEGYDPTAPRGLVDRAVQLAPAGDARLVLLQGAGRGATQPFDAVAIKAEREPGEPEHDPTAIRRAVTTLVTGALRQAAASPPHGAGRDLIGLLRGMSAIRGPGPNIAYLRTFVMATVDPADCRLLMAVDPEQAVQSIARSIPDLTGIEVHLELLPPAGLQPPINPRTADWRKAFVEDLLRAGHANLVETREILEVLPPLPGAPSAPVVPSLSDPTPPPRQRSPSPGPLRAALDSSATFVPDRAELEDGERAVLAQLKQIIDGVHAGRYGRVTVVGRTARIGPPETARTLSKARAEVVAGLLRAQHVPIAARDVTGLGFDDPLPPDPRSATNRTVTVTAYPHS